MILVKYATRSFIGTRQTQDDSADCLLTENGLFAVVCDGIGSRKNGAASSKMTVESLIESFRSSYSGNFPEFITKAVEKTDDIVFDRYGNSCGTTVVSACIENDSLYWLSVGDSRLYIIRNGKIKQLTTDHNYGYVLELRKQKNLIDDETYNKEQIKAGQLASFIGMGGIDIVDVSMKPIRLNNGDRLLLSTDGLYKPLAEKKICDIIYSSADPSAAADHLLSAVKQTHQPLDNTTFTLIFFDKTEEEQ